MDIKNEDYIKHWGIKGMKWDADKKQNKTTTKEAPKYDVNKTEKLRKFISDQKAKDQKVKEQLANTKLEAGLQKARDAKKARDEAAKKSKRMAMTKSIKSISSDSVKKGKAFLDKLFNKSPKISPTNAIRKKNNSSPI